jgi:hypothetical protein
MDWHNQLAHSRGATSCASTPKARGLRLGYPSPCGRRYRPPTTTPHRPLLSGIGISSGVSPFLLSTSLNILRGASRVRCVRLKQNDVGGVFLAVPSALCGSPVGIQGRSGWPVWPAQCNALLWPLLLRRSNNFGRDWLASQTRNARGSFSRRTMHASGDSPCHSSAKHHLLGACLPRMAPFRSMLLTLESGL